MASLFVVLAYSVCRCQSEQKQMILTIEMDSLVLTEGDEAEIQLRIHGITSKINSYTFRLEYEMTSKFRKQRMRKKKNIVWNPQEGDLITLSEMITECDSYHIQICSVSWEDLTGMYKVKKEFNKQISFLVMPKRYEMGFMQEKIARRDLMEQGFEYDGVRKYQEGDRISRVHWNLYAATGGLWVRKNEEEEEEGDPREELVRRLIEYKIYKYAAEELKDLSVDAQKVFFKSETVPEEIKHYEEPIRPGEIVGDVTLEKLNQIFQMVMRRKKDREDPVRSHFGKIQKEKYKVEDRMDDIRCQIRGLKRINFRTLLDIQPVKEMVIVTFLAVLELMKVGEVKVVQEHNFAEIYLDSCE